MNKIQFTFLKVEEGTDFVMTFPENISGKELAEKIAPVLTQKSGIIMTRSEIIGDTPDTVTVICYGEKKEWIRSDAICFFSDAVQACDGCEQSRYASILADLVSNKPICSDGSNPRKEN